MKEKEVLYLCLELRGGVSEGKKEKKKVEEKREKKEKREREKF